MPVAADDVRTFESVIAAEATPEESQENQDYFREQGLDANFDGAPDQPAGTEETKTPKETRQPVGTQQAEDADPDADTTTDVQSDQAINDGEKLGWRAKKTKQIKDLEGKLQSTTAEKDGQIAELRRQLAARETTSPAAASAGSGMSAPSAPKEETKLADAPKVKEFDKPRPVAPKFADFASTDDPVAAHADAVAAYADKLSDWKDEKREFDSQQKSLVQEQTNRAEQERTAKEDRSREVREKLDTVIAKYPDWRETTKGKFTPVLDYVLSEAVPNGLEIAYLLAKLENAAALESLRKSSQHAEGESQRQIEKRIVQATYDVAVEYQKLQAKPVAEPEDEEDEESDPPVIEDKKPKQTPPKVATPRREEAAPTPVRSRGAAALRLEDIPAENYDARRKWREAHGEL